MYNTGPFEFASYPRFVLWLRILQRCRHQAFRQRTAQIFGFLKYEVKSGKEKWTQDPLHWHTQDINTLRSDFGNNILAIKRRNYIKNIGTNPFLRILKLLMIALIGDCVHVSRGKFVSCSILQHSMREWDTHGGRILASLLCYEVKKTPPRWGSLLMRLETIVLSSLQGPNKFASVFGCASPIYFTPNLLSRRYM